MVLDGPWVCELCVRGFEPLARLYTVLASTHQRDDSLRVETSRIVDRLQENGIQFVDFGAVLSRRAGRFVDRFKGHLASFARQLRPDLIPELVEPLLDRRDIGTGGRHVSPHPRVMVHIYNRVEAARSDHVDNVRNALEPDGIHGPSG